MATCPVVHVLSSIQTRPTMSQPELVIPKIHPDEPDISLTLARELLAQQFPQWARLPMTPVVSTGTDHAMYRLGDDMAVRLPRRPMAALQVEKEARWLTEFAPQLPLDIPVPVAKGEPTESYPWVWAVSKWLEGCDALTVSVADLDEAALKLGEFIRALRGLERNGGPPPGDHNFWRGVPLRERDERTRQAIRSLPPSFDKEALTLTWERALDSPRWEGEPSWIHGDLAAGNLLVREGRIAGVLDWGGMALGDPACDLMIGWTLLSGSSRAALKDAVDCDEATWRRARGWTLSVATIAIPYYLETSPAIVRWATRTLQEVLQVPEA